jgi:hypothetical protein
MKIAIVAAPFSAQASTVKDSLESFIRYGNFKYKIMILKSGEINESLDDYDAVILHYSCIALPYRYHKPLSAFSSMRIQEFKGVKLALVQDEQRAGYERLRFFNMLGLNHLFSVAESDLYEILYPSDRRNFSVSTVLTGYISEEHVAVAKRKIPLTTRQFDLVYRGRKLPEWMGKTGTIKGEIPEMIANDTRLTKFSISAHSSEGSRLYGQSWYDFLQSSRVSICTPSGSDFLDLDGRFPEAWIPNLRPQSTQRNAPIAAKYQVISPRFFDSVSAGNLIALTPGLYSNIPTVNTYVELSNDLGELPEILKFSQSKSAQKIVDDCQRKILENEKLHFSFFVKTIEAKIMSYMPNSILQKNYPEINSWSTDDLPLNKMHYIKKFIKTILKQIDYFRVNSLVMKILFYLQIFNDKNFNDNLSALKVLRINRFYDIFNFKIKKEIFLIQKVMSKEYCLFSYSSTEHGKTKIKPVRQSDKILFNSSFVLNKSHWCIDLSDFGCTPVSTCLKSLPKRMEYDLNSLNVVVNLLVWSKIEK